ncbi:MAG: hypothetical protein LJE67_14180 [Salaquimonas sp.]|nr:hypothetical protein [Salaquimonas sp.]
MPDRSGDATGTGFGCCICFQRLLILACFDPVISCNEISLAGRHPFRGASAKNTLARRRGAMKRELRCDIVDIGAIGTAERNAMFALYDTYYSGADHRVFERDLAKKTQVLLLINSVGEISGFSTIAVWTASHHDQDVRVIYSGDTIIDRAYWGSQALAFNWIEHAGAVKGVEPDLPLYWLLTTKGHRTYRYMSAFARSYFPTWREETPLEMRTLMDAIGQQVFGERYDRATGIVRHDVHGAALRKDHAGLDQPHMNNPEVMFFVERNPGHDLGDELLCMCELSEDNLRPMARKQFLKGFEREQMEPAARSRQA